MLKGRVVAPATLPGLVPRAVTAPEHASAHDRCTHAGGRLLDDLRVAVGLTAGPPVLFAPGLEPVDPLVKALASVTQRLLVAGVRSRDEAVEGHRYVECELGHLAPLS